MLYVAVTKQKKNKNKNHCFAQLVKLNVANLRALFGWKCFYVTCL